MSVRLRIIDLRRTPVLPVKFVDTDASSRRVWLALHWREKDWGAILSRALDLLMEDVEVNGERLSLSFAGGAGKIVWRRRAFWTIIRLDLGCYSLNKRRLVAAALKKSMRYGV